MQAERSAEEAALAGSVRGAGVCDVLRVELQPAHRALLVERVEVLRRSPEDEIARQAAAAAPRDEAAIEALGLARYELRLVERLHARLPAGDAERWTGLVGPSGIVSRLVHECMGIAAKRLTELVDGGLKRGGDAEDRLVEAATAAAAWVQTFVDCQAVENFAFDPLADPYLPW